MLYHVNSGGCEVSFDVILVSSTGSQRKRKSEYRKQVIVHQRREYSGAECCFGHVITGKMALYGRYQRVALTILLWGFSFVHSSLIDYSCQNWEGYGKFLDVTFGDQPSLSKASCDQDVELETFSDSPPRVRYSQAVRILIKLHGCLKLIAELERGGTSSLNKSNIAKSY